MQPRDAVRRLIGARRARWIGERLRGIDGLQESRITPADERCPHPEWWHSRDNMATEMEVTDAVAGMIRALQPEYVIETGTSSAQTAIAIGRALRRNGHGRLVTLEIDDHYFGHAVALCRGLPVDVRRVSSMEFTPDAPIDFAWFDSDPAIRHLEFRRYYRHMHDRTVVGFHDTGPMHPVRGLLDEIEAEGLLRTLDFPTPRGFTFARVVVASPV